MAKQTLCMGEAVFPAIENTGAFARYGPISSESPARFARGAMISHDFHPILRAWRTILRDQAGVLKG
ncbi:hypothetical protein LP419_23020 [Massilia sp. H-1]|nr:hypothetical protein LP419_23020 [Massilia sp. H-1]